MIPPLYDPAPPFVCSSRVPPGDFCGEPAKHHVIWTLDLENSFLCDECFVYLKRSSRWRYEATHEYETVCSVPGSTYDWERNVCKADEDFLGISEAEKLELVAP